MSYECPAIHANPWFLGLSGLFAYICDWESENERTNEPRKKNARLPSSWNKCTMYQQCKSNHSVLYLSNFSCVKPKSKKLITILVDIKWIVVVVVFLIVSIIVLFYSTKTTAWYLWSILMVQGDLSVPNSLPVRVRPKISRGQRNSVVKAFNTFKYGQISLTLKCFTGH